MGVFSNMVGTPWGACTAPVGKHYENFFFQFHGACPQWVILDLSLLYLSGSGIRCGQGCIGGSRGERPARAPPHLPGILVFDDILGHIV